MKTPLVLDCTIRDGGYINRWTFSDELVRDVYRASSKAGVDYVEIGYHGTARFFDSKEFCVWRFSPEETIRKAVNGNQGAHISLMVDFGKFDPHDLLPKKDSVVKLIRIAVHRDHLKKAMREAGKVKSKGYLVSLNLIGFSNYTKH